ncbi:MAG: hypothetical protein HRF50_17385 [Phycisphaerae bacterium]
MTRPIRKRMWLMVATFGIGSLLSTCATSVRDAVVSGAMDFLTAATTTALGGILGVEA